METIIHEAKDQNALRTDGPSKEQGSEEAEEPPKKKQCLEDDKNAVKEDKEYLLKSADPPESPKTDRENKQYLLKSADPSESLKIDRDM